MKIGIVVADKDEYLPFVEAVKNYAPSKYDYFNRDAVIFEFGKNTVICINCGIGKVNAATVAMHLVDVGCTHILNFGLSGGVSKVKRGEVVLPDTFLEHDFDLTGIGYKPCEKPSQKYIYSADTELLQKAENAIGNCKHGAAVCGDRFICSADDRDFLNNTFGATTCDMETAAIASVCDMASVPYLSVRRVSDDAGDDAYTSYNDMNTGDGQTLCEIFLKVLNIFNEVN